MNRGFTTLELAVVLAVVAVLAGAISPALFSAWDRLRVRAAREELVGCLERARAAALRHGSADLELKPDSGLVRVLVDGDPAGQVDLTREYGVRYTLGGGRASARLSFGRLGLGRVANRTVQLFRGADTVSLSVSTFGRLRRW